MAEAEARLQAAGIPEPDISARWIGRQATGTDAADWLDVRDQPTTARQLASFDRMVARRSGGEPLQYVLGRWGFHSLDLFVDDRVLIPRPETEIIALRALDELRRVVAGTERPVAVDLGTGSGAIGLALAVDQPGVELWLTDVSEPAIQVARANLAGLGRAGGAVRIEHGSWFEALPSELVGHLDLIVANPPYVAAESDLEPQVRDWEPRAALVAENGGRAHLLHLIEVAPQWLSAIGALVLEMAPDQVDEMAERAAPRFSEVETIVDLAGRERGIQARYPADQRT